MSQSMDENSRTRGGVGVGGLEMTQRQQSATTETVTGSSGATITTEAATATGDVIVGSGVSNAATGEEEEQPQVVGAPQPPRTQSGEQRQEWEAKINELRAKCRLQAEQLMAWRKAYAIEVSGIQEKNLLIIVERKMVNLMADR